MNQTEINVIMYPQGYPSLLASANVAIELRIVGVIFDFSLADIGFNR